MLSHLTSLFLAISVFILYVSIYTHNIFYFLMFNLTVTTCSFIRKIIRTPSQSGYFLIHGETLFNYFYIAWLFNLNKNQYIYYSPLIISMSAKIYEFFDKNQNFNESILEYLILFQVKCQFCTVIFFLFQNLLMVLTLTPKLKYLILLSVLIVAFRSKYQKNYATQKAINQVHLFIDGVSKSMGCRNYYQKIYQKIVQIFKTDKAYKGKRVIFY